VADADALEAKVERILARAYRGIHHVEGWRRRRPFGDGVSVIVPDGIATYDLDHLTQLVVGAHVECVRLEVMAGGPRRLKLAFHERTRREGGHVWERHPTMVQVLAETGPR